MQGGKTGLVEATSKMDINEFRVFMTMLTMVLPDDEDFIEYEIRTQDIIKLYSLSDDGRYYEAIREAAERLFNKKFIIYEKKEDGEMYRTTIHLIDETSEPVKESEQNRIRLKFNPKLKPYLLQLQKEYLTIDVRNIASIQSPNSVKLYLILRHQYNLGNRKVKYSLVRLREILAITDSEYPLYGNFKQKIIQKGIKDLEKYTDLVISKFEEEKVGRAVDKVIFHLGEKDVPVHLTGMTKKITRQVIKSSNGNIVISTSTPEYQLVEDVENVTGLDEVYIPQISSVESNPIEDLYLQVKEFKITKATLNKWLEELPMEQVQLGITYVLQKIKSGEPIKNIGGYLNTVVRNPSLLEEKKAKIDDETKAIQVVQESQVAKQQELAQEALKGALKAHYFQRRLDLVNTLIRQDETISYRIMETLRVENEQPAPSILAELALKNYKVDTVNPNSLDEFLQNFEVGGIFQGYVLEKVLYWNAKEFELLKQEFIPQAKEVGLSVNALL
ncbi:MAG: replication initiation protein [Spirosomataceae bacterium]